MPSPELTPFSPQPSVPTPDIISCAGAGEQSRGPLAVRGTAGSAAAPAGSLPDAVFSSLSFSLSRCRRGRPGREGRMVVLSLVLGLSEQDDFANIPDLQPAGTQPNEPNAQGDKRYERGRGQSRRRRRRGPHPGWRRRRRMLASWSAKVGAAQGGRAGTVTSAALSRWHLRFCTKRTPIPSSSRPALPTPAIPPAPTPTPVLAACWGAPAWERGAGDSPCARRRTGCRGAPPVMLSRSPSRRGGWAGSSPGDMETSLRWHVPSPKAEPGAEQVPQAWGDASPPHSPPSQLPGSAAQPLASGCSRPSRGTKGSAPRPAPAPQPSRRHRQGLAGAEGPCAAGSGC